MTVTVKLFVGHPNLDLAAHGKCTKDIDISIRGSRTDPRAPSSKLVWKRFVQMFRDGAQYY